MLFSDIELEEREYVWPGFILAGDLTAWIGEEKAGKGLLWSDVAARISRGWPMPPADPSDPTTDWDAVPGPGYVITISLEDKSGADVKPRLIAAGADESMIDDMSHVERSDASGGTVTSRFVINSDLGRLAKRIDELNGTGRGPVRLVIIDPIMAAAGSTISFNQQVRRNIIEPLQELAAQKGVGVLIVGHFTKGVRNATKLNPTSSLTDKAGGSKGIIDACRLSCVVMKDPQNPEVRRLMVLSANQGATKEVVEYMVVANGISDPDAHLEFRQPPPKAGDDAARDRLVQRVLAELVGAERPVSAQEMATYLRLAYGIVKKVMAAAEREGKLEKVRGCYQLPKAIEAAPARGLTARAPR